MSWFLLLWLLALMGGSFYFFKDTVVQHYTTRRSAADVQDTHRETGLYSLRDVQQPPMPVDPVQSLAADPLSLQASDIRADETGNTEGTKNEDAIVRIDTAHVEHSLPSPVQVPPKPAPLLKTKDMWTMPAVQQRAYLQVPCSFQPPFFSSSVALVLN